LERISKIEEDDLLLIDFLSECKVEELGNLCRWGKIDRVMATKLSRGYVNNIRLIRRVREKASALRLGEDVSYQIYSYFREYFTSVYFHRLSYFGISGSGRRKPND
jgi:hypothetical protein